MSLEELSKLLTSLLMAVREDIAPDLQTAQVQHRLSLVDMLMTRLIANLSQSADEQSSSSDMPIISTDAVDALHNNEGLTAAEVQRLQLYITDHVAAEHTARARVEANVAEITASTPKIQGSGDELSISVETFTEILRQRMPNDPSISASSVTVVPGGRSKGTVLVETTSDAGMSAIVVRRDFSISVTGVSVVYEYPIIKALADTDVPVPNPLWLETNQSVLGGAYIAFDKVPGKAMGTLFYSDASPAFVKEFAAVLAKVHCADIDGLGIANQLNWGEAEHPVRAMVDVFYQRYVTQVGRVPLLDTAFAWLYLKIDKIGNERALVHGDAGLHNTMGENDVLTGLLDWEFAHAGDPAEDLCYCKHLVQSILPWQDFMSAYQEHGGQMVSEERMEFFTVWRTVQLAIQMGGARALFQSGRDQDLRIATIGFNSFPKILNDLAVDLAMFTA